jgi:hypothetical protein
LKIEYFLIGYRDSAPSNPFSCTQKTSPSGGSGRGWANITKPLLPLGFGVINRWGKPFYVFSLTTNEMSIKQVVYS